MIILGIDPGLKGALAIYNDSTNDLLLKDMPTQPVSYGTKSRQELNYSGLHQWLKTTNAIWCIDIVCIERVNAMPGQGVTSCFRFGEGFGALKQVCACHSLPVAFVSPGPWKRHFGLSKAKGVSRSKATSFWPTHHDEFERVKDDGRAEAALIARYYSECVA